MLPSSTTSAILSPTFASLRNRNYRLFFIGQLVSNIGTWMQRTAEGWLVYQLTGSKLLLGTVAALAFAPMVFFSTVGGALADRYPKRGLLLIIQIAGVLPPLAMGILILGQWVQVWHIMLLAALSGIVMAFDMPTRQAFAVEMVGEEDLLNAIALNSAMFNAARLLGPAIAGFLMAYVGIGPCYLLNALSFLAVVFGLALMKLPPQPTPSHSGNHIQHALGGFSYLKTDRFVAALFAIIGVVGLFGFSFQVLMPVLAKDVFGVKEEGYGLLMSATGIGGLLGSLTIASLNQRADRRKIILAGIVVYAVSLYCVSVTGSFTLALLFLAAAGCGLITCFSTTNTLIQTTVPDEVRGRVMGIWALVIGGVVPISSLQTGAVAHCLGARATLQISAAVCALAAVWGMWGMMKQKGT